MNAALQLFDGVVMVEHDSGRDAAPLPIVDPLLNPFFKLDSEQFCEGCIASSGLNESRSLGCIHAADINISFTDKSNGMFTSGINRLFSLGTMEPEKERVIDRVQRWEGTIRQKDLAKRLGISTQALNNWKERDVPPKEYVRLAQLYGCSIDVLTGVLPDDDRELSELMAIWRVLIPTSRTDLIKSARYIRTIQNPVGETGPQPILADPEGQTTTD